MRELTSFILSGLLALCIALPVQAQERTYSYRSEGAVGTLKLGTKDNDGKYPISIQTTNESNMRMCEFDGKCVRTDSGLTCDDPESGVPELRLTIQEHYCPVKQPVLTS